MLEHYFVFYHCFQFSQNSAAFLIIFIRFIMADIKQLFDIFRLSVQVYCEKINIFFLFNKRVNGVRCGFQQLMNKKTYFKTLSSNTMIFLSITYLFVQGITVSPASPFLTFPKTQSMIGTIFTENINGAMRKSPHLFI